MIERSNLPKWPALAVEGRAVSIHQAAEIIVRTDSWDLTTNDHAFRAAVVDAANFPPEPECGASNDTWHAYFTACDDFRAALGVLDLAYLTNSQIVSSWIGGPHGWCAWDGTIGSSNYNVGKWPSCHAIMREWETIASAFPFLDLRAQLFGREVCEAGAHPVIEYVVRGGGVTAQAPTTTIPLNDTTDLTALLSGRRTERGCTISQIAVAVNSVRAERGSSNNPRKVTKRS